MLMDRWPEDVCIVDDDDDNHGKEGEQELVVRNTYSLCCTDVPVSSRPDQDQKEVGVP
jgi:hypothetical protein